MHFLAREFLFFRNATPIFQIRFRFRDIDFANETSNFKFNFPLGIQIVRPSIYLFFSSIKRFERNETETKKGLHRFAHGEQSIRRRIKLFG